MPPPTPSHQLGQWLVTPPAYVFTKMDHTMFTLLWNLLCPLSIPFALWISINWHLSFLGFVLLWGLVRISFFTYCFLPVWWFPYEKFQDMDHITIVAAYCCICLRKMVMIQNLPNSVWNFCFSTHSSALVIILFTLCKYKRPEAYCFNIYFWWPLKFNVFNVCCAFAFLLELTTFVFHFFLIVYW